MGGVRSGIVHGAYLEAIVALFEPERQVAVVKVWPWSADFSWIINKISMSLFDRRPMLSITDDSPKLQGDRFKA